MEFSFAVVQSISSANQICFLDESPTPSPCALPHPPPPPRVAVFRWTPVRSPCRASQWPDRSDPSTGRVQSDRIRQKATRCPSTSTCAHGALSRVRAPVHRSYRRISTGHESGCLREEGQATATLGHALMAAVSMTDAGKRQAHGSCVAAAAAAGD